MRSRDPLILVVDDDPNIVRIVRVKLERNGLRVDAAANGREALVCIENARPDLILLDVMMPVMDGLELVQKLKDSSDLRTIPVFLLTARGQMDDKKTAYRIGVEDYITKPFSPSEVLRRVQAHFAEA